MKTESYKPKEEIPLRQENDSEKVDEILSSTEVTASTEQFTEKLEVQQNKLLDRAENLATQIENSSLPESRKQKLLEKIKKISLRSLKAVAGSTVLFFAFVTADHQATRWKVDVVKDPIDHSTRYKHKDAETTHIINVLAGIEKLTLEEKISLMKETFSRSSTSDLEYFKENAGWSGNIDELRNPDMRTIASLIRNLDLKGGEKNDQKPNAEKSDEEILDSQYAVDSDVSDEKVYKALWEMMRQCGNPKIHLTHKSGRRSGEYDPITNTIYLSPKQNAYVTQILIAELAHGAQFEKHPYKTSFQGVKDWVQTGRIALFEGRSVESSYDDAYDREGSLEYEAHSIIEPKLQEEFDQKTADGLIALKRKELEQKRINDTKQAKEKVKSEERELMKKQYAELAELGDRFKKKSKGIHGPKMVRIYDWYDAEVALLKQKHHAEDTAFREKNKNNVY